LTARLKPQFVPMTWINQTRHSEAMLRTYVVGPGSCDMIEAIESLYLQTNPPEPEQARRLLPNLRSSSLRRQFLPPGCM
jgi:hypothetical protein